MTGQLQGGVERRRARDFAVGVLLVASLVLAGAPSATAAPAVPQGVRQDPVTANPVAAPAATEASQELDVRPAPDQGNGPDTAGVHPLTTPPVSPTVDIPADGYLRIDVTSTRGTTPCRGAIGIKTGWTFTSCESGGTGIDVYLFPVPLGDTYVVFAYADKSPAGGPLSDVTTDVVYWNNTAANTRLRSKATPYVPSPGNTLPPNVPPTSFHLEGLPWLGTDASATPTVYYSPAPVYVGMNAMLDISFAGASGVPSGVVEVYDDNGFVGDGVLSGGTVHIRFPVRYAGAWSAHVYYRGNAIYADSLWDVDLDFLPTVDEISDGYGPTAGGTTVTITGYALYGATDVLFDGVPGTDLRIFSDTTLWVTTPAGTNMRAPVVITTASASSHWDANQFFAYTDSRVVAGTPSGVADVHSFTPGVVRCYQVTGRAGVPVGAVGVTLNVTASLPNAPGHVRVYPDYNNNGASPAPAVSTVNFEVNRDVANSTTIKLPDNGKVCAYSVGGTLARLILDVESYTLPGSGITLITPEKLVDTRSQSWYHKGSINGPVQPMTDYKVQVGGVGSVPADAVAVMVNITVVDTNFPGHLRMWASDQAMPNTSVVNYAPETKANSQIVALSAGGQLTFRSFSWVPTTMSPVQVLIDVTGYITAGSDFTATTPTTVVETRPAYTPVGLPAGALTQNKVYPLTLDTSVVPAGATAVVLNVTVVQPTNFGHIRVYPDTNGLGTTTPPIMSNINFIPGRDIPNMVIVQLPPGRTIDFYTAYSGSGQTNLKVDFIGYIGAPSG